MTEQNNPMDSRNRAKKLQLLQTDHFELLVIGGGATGCGIALDAASRGIKTALIEKGDFASGTSSKSTKLIHGGLRYLKQLDIALVRESGTERAVVNRLAPHLCLPEKMLLPLTEDGTFGKFSTSIGLWFYDFLAKVEDDDKRIMLSKKEALEKEPLLKDEGLKGAGYYSEYRTDDARLTIEIIKKAAAFGGHIVNYSEAVEFVYSDDQISAVKCIDNLTGETFTIKAKKIVSAGGPWVDQLRRKNNSITNKRLHLSKGVHIVVPHNRLALQQSMYFDIPDGRMAFAIPRGRVTYIGTTDTTYTGSLDRVVSTVEDRDYLLKAINNVFNTVDLTEYDIISSWAGLRPLIHEDGKSPSELSRKDEIFVAPDGLISIAGGKLTGYRKMAERIVDLVVRDLETTGQNFADCKTDHIALTPQPLIGNQEVEDYIIKLEKRILSLGLDKYYACYLTTNYGTQAENILNSMKNYNAEDKEVAMALAEVDFCIAHEMVQRAEDYFVRRSGRLYFDILTIPTIKEKVLEHMSQQLNWTPERKIEEVSRIEMLIQDATTFYEEDILVANEST